MGCFRYRHEVVLYHDRVDLSVCEMGCFRYRHEVVLYHYRVDLSVCEMGCFRYRHEVVLYHYRVDLSVCEMGCFRYRHEVVLYNNRILMIGGGQAIVAYSMDKVSLTEWLFALRVNVDIVPGSSGSLKVWYVVRSVC